MSSIVDILTLSAEQILAIPAERPDKLFNEKEVVQQARSLISKWHPDRNAGSEESTKVFKHLKHLKEKALEQIGLNTWKGKGSIMFLAEDRKMFRMQFSLMHEFELGKMYIGHTKVIYVLNNEYEDFFRNAIVSIKRIHYPSTKFKEEFPKFLPDIHHIMWNTSIGHVLVMNKTKDVVLLKDLLDYFPERKLPVKHVAWICNSILNTMCFLNHIDINLNAISTSTVFVSPQYHSSVLMNGWWYATKCGGKLVALPSDVLEVLTSKSLLKEKLSTSENNLIALRALALECLGDSSKVGSKFLKDDTVPKEFLGWLRSSPFKSPIDDYIALEEALHKAWGKRTFIDLPVDISKIYQ